ncbi:probable carboxylesterase 6 [Nymphaea colorata]|nr:probable carboxylesterase 6 [Nymphaea colorata]
MAPKQVELEAKKLRVYTDGTVDRAPQPVANASPTTVDGVASKDVAINLKNGVTGRLYKPQVCDTLTPTKLPLLFYYHGDGFCTGSCSQVQTHNFLHSLCLKTRTLVIAVDYRLSPEHRLPAQYQTAWTRCTGPPRAGMATGWRSTATWPSASYTGRARAGRSRTTSGSGSPA